MNLNNKKLAIGLSIAAVVVVVYQVFLNKPEPRRRRPSTHQTTVVPSNTGSGSAPVTRSQAANPAYEAPAGPTNSPGDGTGLVIDYNSEILLKRVPREFTEAIPRQELPSQLKPGIFSFEKSQRGKSRTKNHGPH